MIVRKVSRGYLLVAQHDHALISGEFAEHWAGEIHPAGSTLYAVRMHDVAWKQLDQRVRWNEDSGSPYSFVDYPVEDKLKAQREGMDFVEMRDPYAAILCSMHYVSFVRHAKEGPEAGFRGHEEKRQERLRTGMSAGELENLERNLRFLKLCDGLSLFLCLNEPGSSDRPPPYPEGFVFDGERFDPMWEDERTLRFDPNPFTKPFYILVPYQVIDHDRRPVESNNLELRVTC